MSTAEKWKKAWMEQLDYSIALQKFIEHLIDDLPIPRAVQKECPHHYYLLMERKKKETQ